MGLIGGILLVVKNKHIRNKKDTLVVLKSDAFSILIILGIGYFLIGCLIPSFRCCLLLIMGGIYSHRICNKYFLNEPSR